MKKISRRQFLGYSTKAGAATMFAGVFASSTTGVFGFGSVAQATL
ncbi:hypothetical protein [Kaarinaea lacus]